MKHWSQHSYGYLPDGSRVMLASVEADYPSRRKFPVVLQCRPDGLWRLWRDGSSRLLAPGYVWPNDTKEPRYKAETSLQQHLPKSWGLQHLSSCVIKQIPKRILNAKTANLARLLIAWFFNESIAFAFGSLSRANLLLRPLAVLPQAPLWRPVAITVVPNTDVVVRALHSGVLLQRLKLGLERIYVSDMACIRAPRIESSLHALARRFPERLVLVKAENYGFLNTALKIRRVRASEYQFVGYQLQGRYEDDFGYDKFNNPTALVGMMRFRIGDEPKGSRMWWIQEEDIGIDQWDGMDIDGMLLIEQQAKEKRALQQKKASAALAKILIAKKDAPNGST